MTRHALLIALAITCSGCLNEADRAQAAWIVCRAEVLRKDPKAKLAAYDASHVRKKAVLPSYVPQNPDPLGYHVQIFRLREAGDTSEIVEGDWSCNTDGQTVVVTQPAFIIDRFPLEDPLPVDQLLR